MEFIDAKIGDAFNVISNIDDQFDFIFLDADKDRYKLYFDDLYPKLVKGGCYLVHNVFENNPKRFFRSIGIKEYVDYIKSLDNMKTGFDTKGGGMSISYKLI